MKEAKIKGGNQLINNRTQVIKRLHDCYELFHSTKLLLSIQLIFFHFFIG